MAEKLQMGDQINDVENIKDASKINLKGTEENLDSLDYPPTDEERWNDWKKYLEDANIRSGDYIHHYNYKTYNELIKIKLDDGKFHQIKFVRGKLIRKDENSGREDMNESEILEVSAIIYDKTKEIKEYKENLIEKLRNDEFGKTYLKINTSRSRTIQNIKKELDNADYFWEKNEYKGSYFNIKGGKITFEGYNKEFNINEGLRIIAYVEYLQETNRPYNFKRSKKGNLITENLVGSTTLLKNDVIKEYLPSIENDESFIKFLSKHITWH